MTSAPSSRATGRGRVLRCAALRVDQHPNHPLYLFALTATELWKIAALAHLSRDSSGKLAGYQRPAVKQHIRNIAEYLDSERPLLPNSIVMSLSSSVRFVPGRRTTGAARHGTLEIPMPRAGQPKPGWLIDGQQRALALSSSSRSDFPVPVNAFVADDVGVHREQFLRVNSVKPLPRGLTTELLPSIDTVLPAPLARRRAPSALCDILNQDSASPFFGLVKRASGNGTGASRAVVTDTALVKVLQDALAPPNGALARYLDVTTGQVDLEGARRLLVLYWSAVREAFPEAWGQPPSRSRLMHSTGLRAMGRLMNRIMALVEPESVLAATVVRNELERIVPACRWTRGRWEQLDGLAWNDIQNVPTHVRMLSNFLVRQYIDGPELP